jgi:DNA-binding NarL/FixJ family response regulator
VAADPVRWLHVLVVPLEGPGGSFPWLVHAAADCTGPGGAESYLHGVIRRTLPSSPAERRAKLGDLTRREQQVVRMLCRGATLHDIARALGVQYVTVRNHVQHIEAKLGVHSLLEIVAYGLTTR